MSKNRKEKVKFVIAPFSLRAMEIENDIRRMEAILATNIFSPDQWQHPLWESAFVELMICLNDLLSKIDNVTTDSGENFRVAFTDNIELIEDDIGDITDLVSRIRNAACHMSSDIRIVNEPEVGGVVSFVFNIVEGKSRIKVINDFVIECEFEDDIAIYYGVLRIYLKRHIHRALDEAKQIILPLIRPHFYR